MPSQGKVVGLQLCAEKNQPVLPVATAHAIENLGLQGDRHAKPDSKRQVLLIEAETLEKLELHVGDVRENITTRGIDLMKLPAGTQLAVGEAILQLTLECEPCKMMDDLRPGLREILQGQRGMLARVLRGGVIRVGDAIHVEAPLA